MNMQSLKDIAEEAKKKAVKKWKEGVEFLSLKELMGMSIPPNQWKIDQIVPLEGITIISAPPASYKTWLILQMAIDIAQGKPFLGKFPSSLGKVLMIDEENHKRLIQKRLKALGAHEDSPIHVLSKENFVATEERMTKGILEYCDEHGIDTIFIDSLVRINRSDENDAGNMSTVFRALSGLCDAKKTVIITHHERKENGARSSAANRMRGSSDIQAAVDSHLAISRDRDDPSHLYVEHAKSREELEIPMFEIVVHTETDRTWFEHLGSYDMGKKKKDEAKEVIPTVLRERTEGVAKTKLVAEVRKLVDVGGKNVQKAIEELINEGLVRTEKGSGNTVVCFLAEPEAESSTELVN